MDIWVIFAFWLLWIMLQWTWCANICSVTAFPCFGCMSELERLITHCTILHSYWQGTRLPLPPHPHQPTLVICWFFDKSAPDGCEVEYHCSHDKSGSREPSGHRASDVSVLGDSMWVLPSLGPFPHLAHWADWIKSMVLRTGYILQSLGELLKISIPRPFLEPVIAESRGLGPRSQYSQNSPDGSKVWPKWDLRIQPSFLHLPKHKNHLSCWLTNIGLPVPPLEVLAW